MAKKMRCRRTKLLKKFPKKVNMREFFSSASAGPLKQLNYTQSTLRSGTDRKSWITLLRKEGGKSCRMPPQFHSIPDPQIFLQQVDRFAWALFDCLPYCMICCLNCPFTHNRIFFGLYLSRARVEAERKEDRRRMTLYEISPTRLVRPCIGAQN